MSAKLKLLERKLGLVPKQYPPMSQGMERIARRQAPAPVAEGHDLGAMIEQAIQSTVDQRVEQALVEQRQRQPPAPMPTVASPPVEKTPPVVTSKVTRRDEFGRILWSDATVEGTGKVFRTEMTRDELGGVSSTRTYLLPDQAAAIKPPEPRGD